MNFRLYSPLLVLPDSCVQEMRDVGIDCTFYYNGMWKVNIVNCTGSTTGNLSTVAPPYVQIPSETDWFLLQDSNLEYFCMNSLNKVSVITITDNRIKQICNEFWDMLSSKIVMSLTCHTIISRKFPLKFNS